jgi:hypothetical protein
MATSSHGWSPSRQHQKKKKKKTPLMGCSRLGCAPCFGPGFNFFSGSGPGADLLPNVLVWVTAGGRSFKCSTMVSTSKHNFRVPQNVLVLGLCTIWTKRRSTLGMGAWFEVIVEHGTQIPKTILFWKPIVCLSSTKKKWKFKSDNKLIKWID